MQRHIQHITYEELKAYLQPASQYLKLYHSMSPKKRSQDNLSILLIPFSS